MNVKRSSILRPWEMKGPAACRNNAPVHAKRSLPQKSVAPVNVKHPLGKQDWSTRLPAGRIVAQNLTSWPGPVTLEPPLAKPSWAAQHKREPGSPQKIASRAGRTLINFAALGDGWPSGLQEHCSRVREARTFPERCAPLYVKQTFPK